MRAILRKAEINPRHLLIGAVQATVLIVILLLPYEYIVRQILPLNRIVACVASAALAMIVPELLVGTVPEGRSTPMTRLEDRSATLMCSYLAAFLLLYVNYPPFSGL